MSKAVRRINGEKTMTYRTLKLLQFIFAAIICIVGAFISLNMISNINNTDSSSNYSVEVENE